MGRKSVLTPEQWAEIERRLIDGESGRSLAREFCIAPTAIRNKIGAQVREIKNVAN